MPYDRGLAERVRCELQERPLVEGRRLFGGFGYLLNGNLLVAVWRDGLIVRLGVDEAERALNEPHVRPFDLTGRPMRGWVMVAADGVENDRELRRWIDRAWDFVRTLPRKTKRHPGGNR